MKTSRRFRSLSRRLSRRFSRRPLGFTHGTAAAFRAALQRATGLRTLPRSSDSALGALWDPNLLDRLQMPLTRHPY